MIIAEQIVCWLVGTSLLVLTFRLIRQDRSRFAGATFVLGMVILLCGLGWVQGLARTWIAPNVNSKLAVLGEQVDEVRAATTRMQGELSDHRIALGNHQKELEDQRRRLDCVQADLSAEACTVSNTVHQMALVESSLIVAQRNLIVAQEKLTDVESLLNPLYSDSEDEVFSTSDTNKVVVLALGGVQQAVFRLNYVPIPYTVQAMVSKSHTQTALQPGMGQVANILLAKFFADSDLNDAKFHFRYVKDSRNRMIAQRIVKVDTNAVSIDGTIQVFK